MKTNSADGDLFLPSNEAFLRQEAKNSQSRSFFQAGERQTKTLIKWSMRSIFLPAGKAALPLDNSLDGFDQDWPNSSWLYLVSVIEIKRA